jgi:hypothetical protein
MESFLVRVFVPSDGGHHRLAGVIEHVGTGWSAPFASDDELLSSIGRWLDHEVAAVTQAAVQRGRVQAGTKGGNDE